MKRIGLLSDTHGFLDDTILKYLKDCDEIWHAGDIGSFSVIESLPEDKPVKAVYGNIDGAELKAEYELDLIWIVEGMKVYMTHIGGYPGRYSKRAKTIIDKEKPGLFICGHSHILKVMNDPKRNMLHINPGACGVHGFHKIRTLIRFSIDKGKIYDLEVVELGLRAKIGRMI